VVRVLCLAQHIVARFRDRDYQAVTCTGTDNRKKAAEKDETNTKTYITVR